MIHQLKAVVGFKEDEAADLGLPSAEGKGSSREEARRRTRRRSPETRITELSLPQRVEDALDNASIRPSAGS